MTASGGSGRVAGMSKVRAELRIGESGGPDNFVLVDCEVELLPDGGTRPWRATDETGAEMRAETRTGAVLVLFADRLGAGDDVTAAGGW